MLQVPCGSCFVCKFCFLPAIQSVKSFVDLLAKAKRKLYWNILLHTNIPSYYSQWSETSYFLTFPKAANGKCSRKDLVLNIAGKYLWKSNIFTKVTDCKNYSKVSQDFKQVANSYDTFCRHIQKNAFFCVKQYIGFQKQSVGSALKVLAKSGFIKIHSKNMLFIIQMICSIFKCKGLSYMFVNKISIVEIAWQ